MKNNNEEHVQSKDKKSEGEGNMKKSDTDFPDVDDQTQNQNSVGEILLSKVALTTTTLAAPATVASEQHEDVGEGGEEATSEQQRETKDEIEDQTEKTNIENDKEDGVSHDDDDNDTKANAKAISPTTIKKGSTSNCSQDIEKNEAEAEHECSATECPEQRHLGCDPRELISKVMPNTVPDLRGTNNSTIWNVLSDMLCSYNMPKRKKLRHINTFNDVLKLLRSSQKIIVLTGAGVSVSCGIPDFRSSNGIYTRLARDYPDLPDPQAMFDINYFSRDPRPFFKFAREIYPGQFKPSPSHRFIKMLESKGKLLRNFTQNIDTLEQVAGIKRVIECHGSFATASCTKCKFKCNADDIRADIFAQRIPLCPKCQPKKQQSIEASVAITRLGLKQLVKNGIMKPDIVFFGEDLPKDFYKVMATDKDQCDLLIVMGSSLKVSPVNGIPNSIPASIPQILINREKLRPFTFDVELLGDSDVTVNQLCHSLGADWQDICFDDNVKAEFKEPEQQNTNTQSIESNASTDSGSVCSDRQIAGLEANEAFEKNKTNNKQGEQKSTTNANNKDVAQKILDLLGNADDPLDEAIKRSLAAATINDQQDGEVSVSENTVSQLPLNTLADSGATLGSAQHDEDDDDNIPSTSGAARTVT